MLRLSSPSAKFCHTLSRQRQHSTTGRQSWELPVCHLATLEELEFITLLSPSSLDFILVFNRVHHLPSNQAKVILTTFSNTLAQQNDVKLLASSGSEGQNGLILPPLRLFCYAVVEFCNRSFIFFYDLKCQDATLYTVFFLR